MAKLFTAESAITDPLIGGFIVEFPSGARKSVSWRQSAPIAETLEAAKAFTVQLVQHCLDSKLTDDLERTNIPSLVAGVQKIIMDWNEKRRAALYAEREKPAVH